MSKTILLVEDEPNDVLFMQHAMQTAGVVDPIHVASDGRQAIDYFKGAGKFANRETFPLPSLVLLDLKLPYVMGLDVLKWIRQQPDITAIVLILSASKEEADITTAYHLGANGYLVKPSDMGELRQLAKAIKDFWLTHNTLPQEFPRERTAVPAHSRTVESGQNRFPDRNGTRWEEYPHDVQASP